MFGFIVVLYFLFKLFFSLITFVLWTRLALRYYKVSLLNPVSQMIYTLTNPLVTPLSKLFGQQTLKQYDWPCFAVLLMVEVLKLTILFLLAKPSWNLLPVYVLADLIIQPCNLLFYAILVRVIMSWVNPNWYHPLTELLVRVTEPLLRLGRRVIPDISGFDFSPIFILVSLEVIVLFINSSLPLRLL